LKYFLTRLRINGRFSAIRRAAATRTEAVTAPGVRERNYPASKERNVVPVSIELAVMDERHGSGRTWHSLNPPEQRSD
jgi:hypothetical protein